METKTNKVYFIPNILGEHLLPTTYINIDSDANNIPQSNGYEVSGIHMLFACDALAIWDKIQIDLNRYIDYHKETNHFGDDEWFDYLPDWLETLMGFAAITDTWESHIHILQDFIHQLQEISPEDPDGICEGALLQTQEPATFLKDMLDFQETAYKYFNTLPDIEINQ